MVNRWIGILTLVAMILANGAIFWRDVLPSYYVGDPPPNDALTLAPNEIRRVQVGIYDRRGDLIGQSWTRSRKTGVGGLVLVVTTTVLRPIVLPNGAATPAVRVDTEITFRNDEAVVDELDFRIFGLGIPITLRGETMPTGQFPIQWEVGPRRGRIVLDSRAPQALGDVIRPFDRLPQLYVGRSWRLELLDPLSQIVPNIDTTGLGFEAVLIQVTRKETIEHRGQPVSTYVVEGGGATAWVNERGDVLRQEVQVPILGQLVLLDEEYDDETRVDAIRMVTPGWTEVPETQPETPLDDGTE
jgi:hypothetical protein